MAFDNIKLEKGLYTTGKSFTAALEELDPSDNYIGTPLEGLDAYERQLKRYNIKVSGPNSDTVSKFFVTSDSAALFPEYIARAVKTGLDAETFVEDIVACTTEIDGLDYRSVKTNMPQEAFELARTSEGQLLAETHVKLSGDLTKLKKHGRMLVASYEAIKYQRLDLFTTVLKKIGSYITRSEFKQALDTFDNDDTRMICYAGESITFEDIAGIWLGLGPYNLNRLIMSRKMLANLIRMPEFRDANAGLDFHATGNLITPFGAKIILDDSIDERCIFALDQNYALEKVQAGGIITEFDKLIDRQLERATITTLTGFSAIYPDAVAMLVPNMN